MNLGQKHYTFLFLMTLFSLQQVNTFAITDGEIVGRIITTNICDPLSFQLDESGTCSSEGEMYKNDKNILKFAQKRKEMIYTDLKQVLKKQLIVHATDLARTDLLFEHYNAGLKGEFSLTSASQVNSCNISSMRSRFKCNGLNIAKVLGKDTVDNFFASLEKSFAKARHGGLQESSKTKSCLTTALIIKNKFQKDKESLDNIDVDSMIMIFKKFQKGGDTGSVNVEYDILSQFYPDLRANLSSGKFTIPKRGNSKNFKEYFKLFLTANHHNVATEITNKCVQLEEMITKSLCKNDISPAVRNDTVSTNIFGYLPQVDSFSEDEAEMYDSDSSKSYSHYLVNCSAKHWECNDCLSIDEIAEDYLPENSYNELLASIDEDNIGTEIKERGNRDIVCKKFNCENFDEIASGKEVECKKYTTRSLTGLSEKFNCDNSSNNFCSYLNIMRKDFDSQSGRRRVSKFSRQVLSGTTSDKIAGVSKKGSHDNALASDKVDQLVVDTGIAEEDTMDLETSYDRGEKKFVASKRASDKDTDRPSSVTKSANINTKERKQAASNRSSRKALESELTAMNNIKAPIKVSDETDRFEEISEAKIDGTEDKLSSDDIETIKGLRAEISKSMALKETASNKEAVTKAPVGPSIANTSSTSRTDGVASDVGPSIISNGLSNGAAAVQPVSAEADNVIATSKSTDSDSRSGSNIGRGIASLGGGSGAALRLSAKPFNPDNGGYIDESGDKVLDINVVNIEDLNEGDLGGYKLSKDKTLTIRVQIEAGELVLIKVRRDPSGNFEPVDKENIALMSRLEKAPLFKDHFVEVKRVNGMDAHINRALDLSAQR